MSFLSSCNLGRVKLERGSLDKVIEGIIASQGQTFLITYNNEPIPCTGYFIHSEDGHKITKFPGSVVIKGSPREDVEDDKTTISLQCIRDLEAFVLQASGLTPESDVVLENLDTESESDSNSNKLEVQWKLQRLLNSEAVNEMLWPRP